MGAEQSALLACTETNESEPPLQMPNAELYFRGSYFDGLDRPQTGPVTEALLHLVGNVQNAVQDKNEIRLDCENYDAEINEKGQVESNILMDDMMFYTDVPELDIEELDEGLTMEQLAKFKNLLSK
ncbi:uncharacterized protein LOC115625813 [Scaptodrosophila lebanonensis]|uniref:Uncharacterized protein LOC115625813 n=1 Tax=Drosophila lebanonensis TaxID=7225 RepID=A0A6J2TPI1_DROLE|nr:uncharacterized protein LOC115625813 [Scaptodrosophila lebanonensis]